MITIIMKKTVLSLLVMSTLIISWCSWNQNSQKPAALGQTNELTQDQMDIMEKEKIRQQEAMRKKADEVMAQKSPAIYITYNELTAKSLAAAGKHIVLFFYDSWCEKCVSLDTIIHEQISTFPINSVILKVNYATENNLKKQYDVTTAHTLVHVDKSMNMVAKQTGGSIEAIKLLLQ